MVGNGLWGLGHGLRVFNGTSDPPPTAYRLPPLSQRSPKTSRSPFSTETICAGPSRPARVVSKDLSSVTSCDTLTTDGFARPVPVVVQGTFPGASASRVLPVMTAAMTVAIRLTLKPSSETMSTGRRNPGPERAGSGIDAHQISPRFTTCFSRESSVFASRPAVDRVSKSHRVPRRSRSVAP